MSRPNGGEPVLAEVQGEALSLERAGQPLWGTLAGTHFYC
jgi:hypothetical protein